MKIAIVGCGIGGLAAANFLTDSSYDITVYDQFDTPAPVGSGLVIQPVGLKVLEKLGAAEEALSKGAAGYRMLGYEAKSKRKVLDVSYGPEGGSDFGLGIHRSSLFQALLSAAKSKGVMLTMAHKVTGSFSEGTQRYLTFENDIENIPYDLIIDAAGARSPLSPLQSQHLSYGAIWGTVDWPETTSLSYSLLQQRYRRASNMIGILPIGTLPNETTRKAALFWSLPIDGFQEWHEKPLGIWKEQATNLWPDLHPFVEQITDHDQMTMAQYTHGTLRTPYTDGLVHIGDAAHRANPQLGQGANMALLDAFALTEHLKTMPIDQALEAYKKSRKAHIGIYQAMSWAFTPMYQSNSRILPFLRDWIFAPASAIPPVPSILSSLVKGTMISPHRGISDRC